MRIFMGLLEEEIDPPEWETSALADPAQELSERGLRVERFEIAPLSKGWDEGLPLGCFRSGAGPMEALDQGVKAIKSGMADAVVICGAEPLKSGYTREERHRLMAIYGEVTIPEAYDRLADEFCKRHGIARSQFTVLAGALFENYLATFRACRGEECPLPGESWYANVTTLFRGVDCANPLIDYRGQLLLCGEKWLAKLEDLMGEPVEVAGVGFAKLPFDGPDHVARIARFDHLEEAAGRAQGEARVSLAKKAGRDHTCMEIYTCYPVIPLAFLLTSGIAKNTVDLSYIARDMPLTVTGGMNLARAPWNLPALRALIRVGRQLQSGNHRLGVVHGNGGVGYAQGVAILRTPA